MEDFENPEKIVGDYLNNNDVDSACLCRLVEMCGEFGEEGKTAKALLSEVKRLLEIY